MTNSADYINDLSKVTKNICDFFKDRGVFLSENRGFPSYYDVRGINYKEISDDILIDNHRMWPLKNNEDRYEAKSVIACEKLGHKFLELNKNESLGVINRCYMLEGTTLPIRVSYAISPKRVKRGNTLDSIKTEALYVKQMNLNRIFLGSLYHLALGKEYPMYFTESTIIQREKRGDTILESYNRHSNFFSKPNMRRELVKLGVISNFLSLDDMDNGYNILVNSQNEFEVIDFDKGFFVYVPEPTERIVNPFSYWIGENNGGKKLVHLDDEKLNKHFKPRGLEMMVRQEQHKIYHNIQKNLDLFHGIIRQMGHIQYYNLAAKEIYDEKDVVSYFLRKLFEFGKGA